MASTITLDNSNPDVNALKDGDGLEDVFTYTLTDGDLDSDTADLTITINGRTDGAPGVSVDDHNGLKPVVTALRGRNSPGCRYLYVTAPDGLKQISVGGETVSTPSNWC